MKCPSCQHDAPEGAAFCPECGSRLSATCARCGTANPPAHKFCTSCGASLAAPDAAPAPVARFGAPDSYTPRHLAEMILTSRSALEGERKQITVVFVDVSGFTSLSERLDPEDVHRLMTRAFELMLAEVHRYEGTVNQFLGDGIMALFGAPISHEDHARRAALAALGIRDTLAGYGAEVRERQGITFNVRQGLNTGLVVVGSIGSDLRMDYTALGDTTNVAARLLGAAVPGSIVISEATHRLTAGYFEVRELGALALKGKAEPVKAWEVIAARESRTRLEVEAEGGLTPLVGRARELELLSECYEKAAAGDGQIVFIVGEPGIGKSRLLHEFRRRLGPAAVWREGHCLSFGRARALHPVVDLVKRAFGIGERAPEPTIVGRIEAEVARLGDDMRSTLPYLKYLLSVDSGEAALGARSPAELRGQLFDALRRLITRAEPDVPQVVLLEDLHWVDATTQELLSFVADSIPTSRVLLLLTYRPGYTHSLGERTYHTRIGLGALSSEDSAHMARALLSADDLPAELRDLVATKAEGNPFYLEELVKTLLEAGAIRREGTSYVLTRPLAETDVPATVQGVIMARIDRLAPASRRMLQLASVIGREFTRRLLDKLVDVQEPTEAPLRELTALELIHERSVFPELAYTFKHALTHDVAYDSLLKERRRSLHRLVGEGIEELYGDRLAEHSEVLGHHFFLAEDWQRALTYLQKAQEKSAKAFALRDALALNEQALEAARQVGPAVPAATLIGLRRARHDYHFAMGDYEAARAEAERWIEVARLSGDRTSESTALSSAALATQWAEDFDGAREYARAAIHLAEEVDNAWALARSNLAVGHIAAVTADFDGAIDGLDRVLVISRKSGDLVHQVLGLQYRALIPNWRGDYDEAAALVAEGVRIAREHDLLVPLVRSLWLQGIVLTDKGEYDAASAALREALAFSEKLGDERAIPRDLNTLGWLHAECEDHERAVDLGERAAAWASRYRHGTSLERTAFVTVNNADVFLARGDLVLARDALGAARRLVEESANQWMRWRYTLRFHITEGEFWLASGDPRRAEASAAIGLAQATRTGSRKYIARALRLQGEIAAARSDWDTAERALTRALTAARSTGHPPQLWKTHAALGRLHDARRNDEAAAEAYRAAYGVIAGMLAGLRDPDLRAGLERDRRIAQIRGRAGA